MPYIDVLIGSPLFEHWGYVALFLFSVIEALPFLGAFIPGLIVIIAAGFLAKLGIMHFSYVFLFTALGAIFGDLIGYVMGRSYGYRLIVRYGGYFFLDQAKYDDMKNLVYRHSGKVLVGGRFNGLTRAFAPFIAGASRLPFGKFMMYNIIGGISWSLTFTLVGFIFGHGYRLIAHRIGRFIFLVTLISVLLIVGYYFVNRHKRILSKYPISALVLNILSLYVFAKILDDVLDGGIMVYADQWVNLHIPLYVHINPLMLFLATAGGIWVMSFLVLVFWLVLIGRKKYYHAIVLALSSVLGLVAEYLIKIIIHRPRPAAALLESSTYSFPSGHTLYIAILLLAVFYAWKDSFSQSRRVFLAIVSAGLIALMGFSRLYLHVHWLSDVLASMALGVFFVTLSILLVKAIIFLLKTNVAQRLMRRMGI